MVANKKKRLVKWYFFQVRIENPSEEYPEGKRRNYEF